MNRIFIGNKELELEKDTEFQFIFENSIFLFDKLSLQRTTQFKIPRTVVNDTILELSHRPEYPAAPARKVHPATVYYSGGNIEGELKINDFSDDVYNCIFIYGSLLKLKELQDAGKISEYMEFPDVVDWRSTTLPKNSDEIGVYGIGKYINFMEGFIPYGINYLPSAQFTYLFEKCVQHFGISVNYPEEIEEYLKNVYIKTNSLDQIVGITDNYTVVFNPDHNYLQIKGGDTVTVITRQFIDREGEEKMLRGFRILKKCRFEFYSNNLLYIPQPFYAFNQHGEYYGITPEEYHLNGTLQYTLKTNLKEGDEIFFQLQQNHDSWNNPDWTTEEDYFYPLWIIPFESLGEKTNVMIIFSENTEKLEYPGVIKFQNNLPDLTLMNLIGIAKELTGYGVMIQDNILSFASFDFDTTPIILDNKLIQIKKVNRGILDYAQKNVVKFKSAEYVTDFVENIYELDNENLDEEKIVYEIPVSETNLDSIDKNNALSIDFKSLGTTFEFIGKGSELMQVRPGKPFGQITFNRSNLHDIFKTGTQLEAVFFMYQLEFHAIRENSCFLFRSKRYACASGTWTNNTAELKLILLD